MTGAAEPANTPQSQEQPQQLNVLCGRYMLPDMSEHPCQIARINLKQAVFLTSLDVPSGVQIVAYIDELGRLEAQVADPVPGGFCVTFKLTESRLERLRQRLIWLRDRQQNGTIDDRRHSRVEPKENKSHITLSDGRVYACEVIDISLSGAAVSTEVMPALGTYVMLGKMRGRVVRYINSGIAIEFAKQLHPGNVASTRLN